MTRHSTRALCWSQNSWMKRSTSSWPTTTSGLFPAPATSTLPACSATDLTSPTTRPRPSCCGETWTRWGLSPWRRAVTWRESSPVLPAPEEQHVFLTKAPSTPRPTEKRAPRSCSGPSTRHAICHGCTDIIRVKYLFFGVNFCSEQTVFSRK